MNSLFSKSKRVNIRSITLGIDWEDQEKSLLENKILSFINTSKIVFEDAQVNIRTIRLAMRPINSSKDLTKASAKSIVGWVSSICSKVGVRWFCVPFDYTKSANDNELSKIAIDVISTFPNAFINLIVANNKTISYPGIKDASKLIKTVSSLSSNGFDNFRVGISANCNAGTPFFPFANNNMKNDNFSIALETVDLFLNVIEANIEYGIEVVRTELIKKMTLELISINELALSIEKETGLKFNGIDASLAPFPNGESSVAKIIELLSEDDFGNQKTLFFTSFLTNILKNVIGQSGVRAIGFNGVMYSLLEDDYLALRAKQKNFTIDSLMLYSSLCGCGLDMVPVAGDTLSEEITGMILDISGMAITLDKPLGVRILPIPGKARNEITNFNYDFLVDTRLLETKNRGSNIAALNEVNFKYLKEFRLRKK